MTEKEFDDNFVDALDKVLAAMAENPEIEPARFFGMACILENIRFFSPVLYGVFKQKHDPEV